MTNSAPHHSDMGKRELRQMLTTILRASGQVSGGPSGVSPQDFARMSAPISPPPARNALAAGDDPSAGAGGCDRSDDMTSALSNGPRATPPRGHVSSIPPARPRS